MTKLDLEEARAAYDRNAHDIAVRRLRELEDDVEHASVASQVEYWEFLHLASRLVEPKVAVKAARGLFACQPKAPRNVRALRLAKVAVAENRVDKKAGYDTFQQALELAPDADTHAHVLLAWAKVTHDSVTPTKALLEAYDLVIAGRLAKATALAVLAQCSFDWPLAAKRAQKAQDRLLEARGLEWEAFNIDLLRRYMALTDEPSHTLARVISCLGFLLLDHNAAESVSLFATWSPRFDAACERQAISRAELRDAWYRSWERSFGSAGRMAEADVARRAADALT